MFLCSVKRWLCGLMDEGRTNKNCVPAVIGHHSYVLLSYLLVLTLPLLTQRKYIKPFPVEFHLLTQQTDNRKKKNKKLKVHESNITSSICWNFLAQINGWSSPKVVQIRKLFNFGFASIKVEKERINGFYSILVGFVKYDLI